MNSPVSHNSPNLDPWNQAGDLARVALQRAVHSQWEHLLRNPTPDNLAVVVHHWHLWNATEKRELLAKKIDLTAIVRAAIYEEDLQIKNNGFDAITELATFSLVPDLLKLTIQSNYLNQATAGVVLATLVEALYREHQQPPAVPAEDGGLGDQAGARAASSDGDPSRADGRRPVFRWPTEIENLRVVAEAGIDRFRSGSRPEILLVQLSFADLEDPVLDRVLSSKNHPARETLLHLLENSEAPAVIDRLAAYLSSRRPHPSVVNVWRRRSDLLFTKAFLQTIGRETGPEVRANLRKLPKPVWLNALIADISQLTPFESIALVDLIRQSLPNDEEVLEAFARILSQAELPLRRRIVQVVCQISGVKANQMVAELVEWDTDPTILMAVIPELRKRNLSRAMKRLLTLLDHGHAGVRAKASEAFHDCTIERYLAAYDLLEDPVRRSTGQLVYKVDPSANQVLAAELDCGNRIRQIRCLQAIRSIGNVDDLCEPVMALAKHSDPRLKIAAIGTLAGAQVPEAKALIRRYLVDENPAIRKAAEFSLDLARDVIEGSRRGDL
jgi:hypothetical protein